MEKLKERWGIESNFQIVVIFIVFGLTGSAAAKLAGPLTDIIGLTKNSVSGWVYWPIRILLIFPIYQVLLVVFGWLFGQYKFFWNFEKKMLKRLGLGFLFK
ncbi:MAG: diacylglyceryl transferase [Croceitalea sp.]|nr:diacylglyceryl transferase [Croceitalea sp.]NNC35567.1 diacylglyceryl transferase [Croceitalea sp.]NNL07854.1 diacylglyceryl transferase [Croceitalea sp.]NNM17632.1 diacylglyceryl transferase [Croceitalea sp.]